MLTPFVAIATLVGPVLSYGSAFRGAVVPAEIIILGLSIEGAAAVSSAYLLGVGRPGLNSIGMGVGATITVTLDLILIPKYGALGGAITSAVTYLRDHRHAHLHRLPGRPHHAAILFDQPGWIEMAVCSYRRALVTALRPDTAMRRRVDALSALSRSSSSLRSSWRRPWASRSRAGVRYCTSRSGRDGRARRSPCSSSDRWCATTSRRAHSSRKRPTRGSPGWALLRASKLDELPQLFNVLKGDMTLIGPRPEVATLLAVVRPEELGILRVRPGLTGPGQIFYTEVQVSEEDGIG